MPQWMTIAVEPARVQIAPGASAQVTVRLINHTGVVNQFLVSILGLDPRSTPQVQRIGLFPEQEDKVTLTIPIPAERPPNAGSQVVAVRVVAENDPRLSHVEEFSLTVTPLPRASIRLQPTRIRGGSKGRFGVVLVNEGNIGLQLHLQGEDDTGQVRFEFAPPVVQLPPGTALQVDSKARAKRPWTGPEVHRQLTVHAAGTPVPLSAAASFAQKPLGLTALLRGLAVTAIVAVIVAAIVISNKKDKTANAGNSSSGPIVLTTPPTQAGNSTSPPPAVVPAVAGQQAQDAVNALTMAQFTVTPQNQHDNSIASGMVVGTSPEAGQAAPGNRELTLFVSDGPTPPIDLSAQAAAANYQNNDGDLPFPGNDNTTGFAARRNLQLSDGTEQQVLLMHPRATPDGFIFGDFTIPALIKGDRFLCDLVSLSADPAGGEVDVKLYVVDANNNVTPIRDPIHLASNATSKDSVAPIDLSAFAGATRIRIRVEAAGDGAPDFVYFAKPRITGDPGDRPPPIRASFPTASITLSN